MNDPVFDVVLAHIDGKGQNWDNVVSMEFENACVKLTMRELTPEGLRYLYSPLATLKACGTSPVREYDGKVK